MLTFNQVEKPMKAVAFWVLFWSPCPTDMCLENEASPVWVFETNQQCEEVKDLLAKNAKPEAVLFCLNQGEPA